MFNAITKVSFLHRKGLSNLIHPAIRVKGFCAKEIVSCAVLCRERFAGSRIEVENLFPVEITASLGKPFGIVFGQLQHLFDFRSDTIHKTFGTAETLLHKRGKFGRNFGNITCPVDGIIQIIEFAGDFLAHTETVSLLRRIDMEYVTIFPQPSGNKFIEMFRNFHCRLQIFPVNNGEYMEMAVLIAG